MRKLLAAFALIFAVLAAAGCGEKEAGPGFTEADLYLKIGGKEYRCGANIKQAIDVFGDGYEYGEAMSCLYEGLDKSFIYDFAEFYTYPVGDEDYISEINTSSPEVTTSMGIRVGGAREDVLAVYGPPSEDTGSLLIYELPSTVDGHKTISLNFMIEEDIVTSVWLALNQE